jgi:hypothetical protein
MTTAEMLRAEGEAHGRAAMLVELLTLKFGPSHRPRPRPSMPHPSTSSTPGLPAPSPQTPWTRSYP